VQEVILVVVEEMAATGTEIMDKKTSAQYLKKILNKVFKVKVSMA
jgi:predicted component of type VI protein secretion system